MEPEAPLPCLEDYIHSRLNSVHILTILYFSGSQTVRREIFQRILIPFETSYLWEAGF
jgi:hypothetical protein